MSSVSIQKAAGRRLYDLHNEKVYRMWLVGYSYAKICRSVKLREDQMKSILRRRLAHEGYTLGWMTPDKFQEVKRLHADGKSLAEMVAVMGVSLSAIRKAIELIGAPMTQQQIIMEKNKRQACELFEHGRTAAEVAKMLKLSRSTINVYIAEWRRDIKQRRKAC